MIGSNTGSAAVALYPFFRFQRRYFLFCHVLNRAYKLNFLRYLMGDLGINNGCFFFLLWYLTCFRLECRQCPLRNRSVLMGFNYKKNRPWAENLTIVMQLGLTMAGCITFCFFIGLKLDQWLGTKGVFITVFTLLGVLGGANVVYRQVMDIIRDKENEQKGRQNGID
ncbi:MAG: AtpZ/AtpI family protein [Deltaproteobacteria bacterium]|nr:AtpZ/AtpI family protein [Deltaproteobacteria bacterium]